MLLFQLKGNKIQSARFHTSVFKQNSYWYSA